MGFISVTVFLIDSLSSEQLSLMMKSSSVFIALETWWAENAKEPISQLFLENQDKFST